MSSIVSKKNEGITKYWVSSEKGSDSVVLIANDIIYKGNIKPEDYHTALSKLSSGTIPNGLFSLPFGYINEIQMQDGKKYIAVRFNKESNEHIRIQDETKKKEIFDYFKANIPNTEYRYIEYSKFKAIKKPHIALVVLSLIFLWAFALASMIEKGDDIGTQLIIVVFLAGFGTKKLLYIFSGILCICAISIGVKINNPPKIHTLLSK